MVLPRLLYRWRVRKVEKELLEQLEKTIKVWRPPKYVFSSHDWCDGISNIVVERKDKKGKIVPIKSAFANGLNAYGLFVLSPIEGVLSITNADLKLLHAVEKRIGALDARCSRVDRIELENADIENCIGDHLESYSFNAVGINCKDFYARGSNIGNLYLRGGKVHSCLDLYGSTIKRLEISGVKLGDLILCDAKVDKLIMDETTTLEKIYLTGTEIKSFEGYVPKITQDQYEIDKRTKLPKPLIDKLPGYEKKYEEAPERKFTGSSSIGLSPIEYASYFISEYRKD